jgi:putative ABC transport system permease protein
VSVVLSLGLGLALLVTVIQIDGNLRRQFLAALPEKAPAFFFLDIQATDAERFDAFIREQAPRAVLDRVPMLRGRIVSISGVAADASRRDTGEHLRCCRRPRHHLHRPGPAGSRLAVVTGGAPTTGGRRWSRSSRRLRKALGSRSTIRSWSTCSAAISRRVANLRTLDWQSLGINFVMVFSPLTFAGLVIYRHHHLSGVSTTEQEIALLKAAAVAFRRSRRSGCRRARGLRRS